MALSAVHASNLPSFRSIVDDVSPQLLNESAKAGNEFISAENSLSKFLVIGHRGSGMNALESVDRKTCHVKENSIKSFIAAARFPLDFIEFDVQVTKDGCPVIFHDNFIITNENCTVSEIRVTNLTLSEFLSYGPQRDGGETSKPLLRKLKDGKMVKWNVESDDPLCTLQDAFQQVQPSVGFNIELKFDDHIVYSQDHLTNLLESILKVVFQHSNSRPVLFSSFNPDAAILVKKLQRSYPVYFLTNGGNEVFDDARRNSLEEALKVCLDGELQGIVSEVKGIFRNPNAVSAIKNANLSLLTYGKLNNVVEAVYMQHLMGVDGVIVDHVQEITEAVTDILKPLNPSDEEDDIQGSKKLKPVFSKNEISFLLKLIPELIQC